VTSQGKTSTDMHMVLDIVDLLQHEPRYDEFIVFSADADFTPVLRRLRRYDRRTTVLAIGFPSAAYQASADLLIDERRFLQDALGLRRDPADPPPPSAPDSDEDSPAPGRASNGGPDSGPDSAPDPVSSAPPTASRPEALARSSSRPAPSDDPLSVIANRIRVVVDQSPVPVSAGHLAAKLKQEYPETLENWNGCGTFRAFFRSLKLSRLSGFRAPAVHPDPVRHEVPDSSPTDEPDSPWAGASAMFSVVRDVCMLTAALLLAPHEMQLVLTLLADDLQSTR
jgi:hypothetical protein